jgi:hypothetical protein
VGTSGSSYSRRMKNIDARKFATTTTSLRCRIPQCATGDRRRTTTRRRTSRIVAVNIRIPIFSTDRPETVADIKRGAHNERELDVGMIRGRGSPARKGPVAGDWHGTASDVPALDPPRCVRGRRQSDALRGGRVPPNPGVLARRESGRCTEIRPFNDSAPMCAVGLHK